MSAAERMSWAAYRRTTRAEDAAYCLFGLFDVNLPLLYGEGGENAILRLQLEIFARNDDFSLLAWSRPRSRYCLWWILTQFFTGHSLMAGIAPLKVPCLPPHHEVSITVSQRIRSFSQIHSSWPTRVKIDPS